MENFNRLIEKVQKLSGFQAHVEEGYVMLRKEKFPKGSYCGEVNKEGQKHGHGLFRSAHNKSHFYCGGWTDDKRSGHGESCSSEGHYIGEWKDGSMCGHGQLTHPEGATDSGETESNDLLVSYSGEFAAGCLHGRGEMKYRDGAVYTGEWVDGERHGADCNYVTSLGHVYVGDDCLTGRGVMTCVAGDEYTGTIQCVICVVLTLP